MAEAWWPGVIHTGVATVRVNRTTSRPGSKLIFLGILQVVGHGCLYGVDDGVVKGHLWV